MTHLAAGSGRERILKRIRLAAASGVTAAPAVFVNGACYLGEFDAD